MAAIDIGPGATDRATFWGTDDYTFIDFANSADGTGSITSIEIWFAASGGNATGVKAGTFSGGGTDYTNRDVETLGNVTCGSKQTFGGLSCSVVIGDFIGMLQHTGDIELDITGGAGTGYIAGDQFGTGVQTYTLAAGYAMSIYGTGATSGWTNISKVGGVTSIDLGKVDTIAVASIAKINGVAV